MPALTHDKIKRTAEGVVESWDMDTLLEYAIDRLIEFYRNPRNIEAFLNDHAEYGLTEEEHWNKTKETD